jgi:hypothetical protein
MPLVGNLRFMSSADPCGLRPTRMLPTVVQASQRRRAGACPLLQACLRLPACRLHGCLWCQLGSRLHSMTSLLPRLHAALPACRSAVLEGRGVPRPRGDVGGNVPLAYVWNSVDDVYCSPARTAQRPTLNPETSPQGSVARFSQHVKRAPGGRPWRERIGCSRPTDTTRQSANVALRVASARQDAHRCLQLSRRVHRMRAELALFRE